jgi:hypothetical protein
MKTDFIVLTDLWQDGFFSEVGDIISSEKWTQSRTAEFCLYFSKYLGLREFEVLYKFLK